METIILHGLADDLGVEAAALRRHLVRSAGQQLSAQTTDATAEFVFSGGSTPADFFDLAVSGDAGGNDVKTVVFKSSQLGMVPFSNHSDDPGVDVTVSGAGDDDDVAIRVEVAGILPDGQKQVYLLSSGLDELPIPLRTAEGDLTFTFTNPSQTVVNVQLAATMKRVKSDVAEAGRRSLRDRGIPVGKAKAGLMGTMVAIAEDSAASVTDNLPKLAQAAKTGRLAEAAAAVKGEVAKKARRKLGGGGLLNAAQKGAAFLGDVLDSEDLPDFTGKRPKQKLGAALKRRRNAGGRGGRRRGRGRG